MPPVVDEFPPPALGPPAALATSVFQSTSVRAPHERTSAAMRIDERIAGAYRGGALRGGNTRTGAGVMGTEIDSPAKGRITA